MSERWARALLSAYRGLGAVAYPFIGGYIGWRATKGKEEKGRKRERYGYANLPRPNGPIVWVHAASVGEANAVIPLVRHVREQGVAVILTTGTVTSAKIVVERLGDEVIHQYVPLDLKPAIARFLNHWKPDLAVIAESEIWPMTILELGARRIPQVLVNGRLSDRSFKAWKKRIFLAEALMENLAHVVAQSELDAERFLALGARPVTVSGNLKVDTPILHVEHAELDPIKTSITGRPTWCAISTHDGEEAIVADCHIKLKEKYPNLLTVIVPRHPDRAEGVEKSLIAAGLNVVCRSSSEMITPDTDILLGDTIGEMGLYLRLSPIAFVGKSLTSTGGQNPLEPAALGAAVISGRSVQNFRVSYQLLVDANAACLISGAETLHKTVAYLLARPGLAERMGHAGQETVASMGGALDTTIEALDRYLQPLVVKARLEGMSAPNGQ